MALKAFPESRSFVFEPDAPANAPAAKAPPYDNGDETRMLDPERYRSAEFARKEWDTMWSKVWVIAGRISDIPNAGDYLKFDLGPESFIIVRQTSGDIRAFYNVCHHRGNQLVDDNFGSVKSFKCAFHEWEWSLDGGLKGIKDRNTFQPCFVDDEPPLTSVTCDTWGGFVFLTMNDDPVPLLDYLGPHPEQLAGYHFEDMRPVADMESEWQANWKVGLDAFMEGYHISTIHHQGVLFLDDYHIQWDLYDHGMSRMLIEVGTTSPRLPEDAPVNDFLKMMLGEVDIDPANFDGKGRDVRRAIQIAKRAVADKRGIDYSELSDDQLTDDWNHHFFPNVTFNVHPEGVLMMMFRPHHKDPEKFIYNAMVLVRPSDDPDYRIPAYMGVPEGTDLSGNIRPERVILTADAPEFEPVLSQDAAAIPRVQRGLRSRAFKGVRLSEQEQRVRHYHYEIDRFVEGRK